MRFPYLSVQASITHRAVLGKSGVLEVAAVPGESIFSVFVTDAFSLHICPRVSEWVSVVRLDADQRGATFLSSSVVSPPLPAVGLWSFFFHTSLIALL